jgi:aminoglycoside 3-N-acetyltransferase
MIRMRVAKKRIKKDLRNLGVKEGDWVLIHSSLKSLGYVKGGADTVIDAAMEVIGESGLLMVPTFAFTNFTPFFDPENTPSQMGLITETLRLREDSVRSWHPRHSVGVLGEKTKEVVSGHLQAGSVGKGSPIDKLAKRGGYILLLGVDHTANTTIHTAEVYAELPYLYMVKDSPDFPEQALVKTPNNGEKIKVDLAPYPTCSEGFWKLEPVMRDKGEIRYGKIGQAHCQLMKSQDIIDTASSLLRENPGFLLCDDPDCYSCNKKRQIIRSLVTQGFLEEEMCLNISTEVGVS